jgi:hypothetical protein
LQMVSPRFILTRPNGELQMTGVKVASLWPFKHKALILGLSA